MMNGGTARNKFQPLLWAGLRDLDTSSAWTRGVVSFQLSAETRSRCSQMKQVLLHSKRYKLVIYPSTAVLTSPS